MHSAALVEPASTDTPADALPAPGRHGRRWGQQGAAGEAMLSVLAARPQRPAPGHALLTAGGHAQVAPQASVLSDNRESGGKYGEQHEESNVPWLSGVPRKRRDRSSADRASTPDEATPTSATARQAAAAAMASTQAAERPASATEAANAAPHALPFEANKSVPLAGDISNAPTVGAQTNVYVDMAHAAAPASSQQPVSVPELQASASVLPGLPMVTLAQPPLPAPAGSAPVVFDLQQAVVLQPAAARAAGAMVLPEPAAGSAQAAADEVDTAALAAAICSAVQLPPPPSLVHSAGTAPAGPVAGVNGQDSGAVQPTVGTVAGTSEQEIAAALDEGIIPPPPKKRRTALSLSRAAAQTPTLQAEAADGHTTPASRVRFPECLVKPHGVLGTFIRFLLVGGQVQPHPAVPIRATVSQYTCSE